MSRQAAHLEAAWDLCLGAGTSTLRVRSDCMAPGIPAGAWVTVARCGAEDLLPGDVVLLRQGAQVYLHRYLGSWRRNGRSLLLCKADGRWRSDALWPAEALAGRALVVKDSPLARLSADGVLCSLRLCLARLLARLSVAAGFVAERPETEPHAAALGSLGRHWRLDLRGGCEALLEHVATRWHLVPAVAHSHVLRVEVDEALPLSGQHDAASDHALTLAASGLIVRLDRNTWRGEVQARTVARALSGMETFFRLAAMETAGEQGGVGLHASAVAVGGEAYVFAGPSGCGKTTSASRFGGGRIVDDDFVLLVPRPHGYECIPWVPQAMRGPGLRVRAVVLPQAGDAFCLTRITSADAVAGCLHLPPLITAATDAQAHLDAVHALVARVPVYSMRWCLGDDLPRLLGDALRGQGGSALGGRFG